jgi:multidrug efflux system membrane fusion protein
MYRFIWMRFGTIKATNTVTVRPQVDGKLLSVNSRKATTSRRADLLARSIACYLSAQSSGDRQKGAGRSAARKLEDRFSIATKDSPPLPRSTNSKAIRKRALVAQNTGAGQAIRQQSIMPSDACYTTIYRTDRRPHRHSHGGRRQLRALSRTQSSIVVITQLEPISVLFNLPQQDLFPK